MSDFESKIDINIDVSQALTAIKTLQRQISDFHTSLAKGSATANLKSLQMQQSLIDTVNATGQYSAQMKTVASATQTFTTALEKNKLSMGQYFKYAGGASKSFGRFFKSEMDTVQKVAIERVKDLQTQYIKMGRDANGAIRSIAIRPLALDMENLATKTQIAAQKQQLLNQLLKQGSTNLLNFGKNTQWAGRQLMVGFTVPLGIFGATAAKTFMQMEEQAIKFKRVYGDTFTATAETDAMIKQIQTLASEFTKYGVAVEKTMEQAATAAAAGKMGADLLAQVTEATRLSVLGNVEQQQALETTISLSNAFGTAADKLRGKINFLNAVENQTVTSIEDLTVAIPKAAPVIQQLGGDVEDLTFFLTAMREGGINASEGANALKSGLASLINPTKKASDFLQGFGININKIVEGNKGNVQGLVVDFAKALDTLDPLNRARAIEQLFGKFQFSRLSTLFQNVIKDGSQAARVLELTKQSSAELGILAQRELNRISASPMYKFQKAIADFKKELAPVGEEFIKAVTPIIQFGTDMLKAFNSLDGGVKQFIVNTTGLIAGIGPIFLMTFGLLANGVANLIKGFTFVKTVFNKTSSASTVLGETTDYMTQQQLEAAAVAASLEQVHNKLTQAFTVEATAVGKLAAAYQKAISAQNAFTGPRPAAPAGRKPKKYADGVFSVPGPKGAGDVVPAMLSPGEAVIPAKMAKKYSGFISGMISGNIPGFVRGTPSVNRSHIQDSLDINDPDVQAQIKRHFPEYFNLSKEMQSRVFFTGSLVAEVSSLLNQKIKRGGGGATADEFSQLWNERTGKLLSSAKIGGADISDPQTARALQEIEDRIGREVEKEARKSGKKITDQDIARVTQRVIKEQSRDSAPARGAKAALQRSSKVLGNLRTNYESDELKALEKQGVVRREGSKIIDNATGLQIGRVKSNGVTLGQKPIDAAGGYARKPFLSRKIEQETQSSQKENNKAKKKNTKAINEDTKETKKGTATKRNARKKAEKKPVTTATTQAKAATPTVKVTEQLGNGVVRTVDANGKERFKVNGRFASPEQAQAMLAARSGATASPGGRVKRFLTGATGKVAGGSMIGSMIARSVGGEGADGLANILDIVSTAAFAKGMFPERPLGPDGKKVPSRIGTAIKGSTIAKKITPYLDDFAKALKVAAPGILRVLGPVGLVVTGGTIAFDILTEKARKQSEIAGALLDTVLVTKDKLEGINNFFGTEAKLSGIRTAKTVGIGETQAGAALADQFRASEEFKNTYKPFVEKIVEGSGKDITLALNSLAVELMASGLDKEVVQIIIDAIKQEAKRTDLVIDVNSLSLDAEGALSKLGKGIEDAVKAYKEKYWQFDPFGFNSNSVKLSLQEVSNFLNGLGTAYQSATISSKDFSTQFDKFVAQVRLLGPQTEQVKFFNETFKLLAPDIAAVTGELYNAESAALMVKLALAGIGVSPEAANILRVNDPKDVAAFKVAADKAFKEKDKQLAALKKKQDKLTATQEQLQETESKVNDKYDERINALERINDLQKQISERQKGQLDLADALSRGDVFGAAKAVQDIRAKEAQFALEQQKQALEDARAKETGAVQDKIGGIQKQIQNIDSQILQIQNANITIDKYLAPEDYKADYTLPEITEAEVRPGVPKGQGLKVLKDEKGKQYFPVNLMDQFLNYPYTVTTKTGFVFPDINGKKWKVTSAQDLGNDGIPDRAYVTPVTKKADGGYISGPGSGTSDSIPARLSNGEYVIRAKAVKALGEDTLDRLNHAEKFARGGMVRGYAPGGPVVKTDTSSDLGLDWFNSFVQNLLGGGNPTSFMQNNKTKNTFVSAYNQGAKNAGIDFADPLFYTNFMPFLGMGAIKGLKGMLSGLKSAKVAKTFTGVGSNTELQNQMKKMYTRTNLRLEDSTYPIYDIPGVKGQVAFEGYGQDLGFLTDQRRINSVIASPEGMIMAALKDRPKDRKLNALLQNFVSKKIGPKELDFLDRFYASVAVSKKGKITGQENTDGLALFLSSLTGNKSAQSAVNLRLIASKARVAANAAQSKSMISDSATDYLSSNFGGGQVAVPANVPTIRSLQGPLEFDKNGNALIYPAGNYRDDFARATTHFTLHGPVQSHMGGSWDAASTKIVSPLSSMIRANGLPRSMDAADTWWMRSPGQPVVVPKNEFSLLRTFTDEYEYGKELAKRGIFAYDNYSSIMEIDPKTKEVFALLKSEYDDAAKERFYQDFGRRITPETDVAQLIEEIGIKEAAKLVGIKTKLARLDSSQHLSDTQTYMELNNLASSLKVPGGAFAHSNSIDAAIERAMYSGNQATNNQLLSRLKSADTLDMIRMAARQGQFKTQVIPPKAKFRRGMRSLFNSDEEGLANGGLVKFAKGGLVKRDVTSFDPGINWLNQFIQNLLGGGNPSAAMQNDATKSLLSQSYVQGAKNMGVDPTDPMLYATMFAPSMGLKSLGMAGKGLSKLKGLSSSKASIPTTTTGFKNYLPDAYVNFMRSNPKIAVRMQSERFMDKLSKGDFEYRNRHSSRDLDSMSKPERADFLSSLQERADIEENVFGIRQDAPGSARPIYGAAVDTRVPWGIRGKQENDLQSAMSMLRGKYSNVSTTNLDRYGDMSLILKNRVKKRSTFTLGDTYSKKNFDGFNGYPGQEWDGYKAAIPAPFGTKSRSQILAADSEVTKNELRFVEAQIFGGLPFSDVKRIIVRNPELIAPLRKSIAQAGLRIPVGESKLSPLGKLMKMLNLKDKSTGLPLFYESFNKPYQIPKFKNGGMFRTSYAQGGLAMLHDKEFVMNAGAVKDYGVNNLKAMNNGTYNGGSVYNSYGVNINVDGSSNSANDIARTVIREIKRLDSQNIRSTKV